MSRQFYPLIVRRYYFIQILGLGSTGTPMPSYPWVLKKPSPQKVKRVITVRLISLSGKK